MKDKTQLEAIVEIIDNISYVEDGIRDAARQILDLCQPKRRSEGIRTSLHDDVADLVTDMWCEDPPDEKDMADKLINKVLDAVDRKIDAEGGEFGPSDDLEKGYDDGLAAALKAVKQLRDES